MLRPGEWCRRDRAVKPERDRYGGAHAVKPRVQLPKAQAEGRSPAPPALVVLPSAPPEPASAYASYSVLGGPVASAAYGGFAAAPRAPLQPPKHVSSAPWETSNRECASVAQLLAADQDSLGRVDMGKERELRGLAIKSRQLALQNTKVGRESERGRTRGPQPQIHRPEP